MTGNPPSPEDPEQFPFWRRNARFIALGCFLNPLGFTVAFPYLPLIVRELGVEGELELAVGVLVFGFFGLTFLLAPVWGTMADHYGRRSMVLRAGLGMAVGFLLMGLSASFPLFMLWYVLVGTCNGYVPAALALVATNTPRQHMGRALSTAQTGALLGTTCGPALGAWLVTVLPAYRHLYLVSAGFCVAAGLIALFFVREQFTRPQGPLRFHMLADVRAILRVPGMGPLLRLNFVTHMMLFGSTTVVSLFVLELLEGRTVWSGVSMETWVGASTLALTIASAMALPFWGRALDRFEPRRFAAVALLAALVATVPFPLVQDPLQLTVARVVLGLLAVGIQPATIRLVKEWSPPGMDGRALALGSAVQAMGNGTGPLLAGLIGPWLGLRAYFAFISLIVLGSLTEWVLRGVRRQEAPIP